MEELEQIMRRIHVLFAKCEPYGDERDGRIIVPKKEMFRLLEKLNYAVIRMMDEYEGTVESRERGISAYQREGERIKTAAQAGADDVYAASLIYVDNMLEELTDVVADAKEELWEQYARMAGRLDARARSLAEDQEEIKQLLTAMAQGEKYLKIIEHENKRLQEAERAQQEAEAQEDAGEEYEYWDEYEEEPYGDDGDEYEEEPYGDDGDGEKEACGEGNGTDVLDDPGDERTDVPRSADGDDGNGPEQAFGISHETEGGAEHKPEKAASVSGSAVQPGGKPQKPPKPAGGQSSKYSYKRRLPASKHARMVPDLEAEWAKEEQRPVRKIGTAIYEDVGQPYDAPVKRVSYEVKVNQAYFDQLGEGNIDLDAEYYQWKEEQEQAAAALEDGAEDGGGQAADAVPENRGKASKHKKGKKKRGLKFGKRD